MRVLLLAGLLHAGPVIAAQPLFADVTGPVLGVEIADFYADGHPDLYVAMPRNADLNAYDRLLLRTGGSVGVAPGAEGYGSRLEMPQPNPATVRTRVGFAVEEPGPVRLALLDALGRELAVALGAEVATGVHVLTRPVDALAAGSYFLLMEAGGDHLVRPLAVVR